MCRRGENPIVKKDEPRMNTNSHEYGWTRSNDQRHRNASAALLPCHDFVDNPSISWGTLANRHLVNSFVGVPSCPLVVRCFPWHPAAVNLNALVALRCSSCVFVDNSFHPVACSAKPGCFRQVVPSAGPGRACITFNSQIPDAGGARDVPGVDPCRRISRLPGRGNGRASFRAFDS